jgi:hypothetical protein
VEAKMSNKADMNMSVACSVGGTTLDVSGVDYTRDNGFTLFVGTGGDVKVDTLDGSTLVYKNIADGSFLPVIALKVYSTGTTASDLLAQW